MVVRDELLLVFDLTSTLLRAGLGVTDLIRGPLIVRPPPLSSSAYRELRLTPLNPRRNSPRA